MNKISLVCLLLLSRAAPAFAADTGAFSRLRSAAGAPAAEMNLTAPAPAAAEEKTGAVPASALGAKLLSASARFLGVPYVLDPLGEGKTGDYDRDPLFSESGLDCTTFVEQAMAGALGGGRDTLRRIRYKNGRIAYESRNHFPEVDWLPNNIAAGFLRDINDSVGGGTAAAAGKVISKRAWYAAKTEKDLKGFDGETPEERKARVEKLRALGAGMPDATAAVRYVPLELLLKPETLARIPSGTVASVVRESRADKPVLITHQFFIFDGPKGKIVRHAAYNKQVLDVPAGEYFAGMAKSSWRVLGLNLMELRSGK